jgi:hypothetical protein
MSIIRAPSELAQRTLYRRAVESVIWGVPAVNFELLYLAAVQAKGTFNQIIFWSRLPDWKLQTLTPDPDVICLMPYFNTKEVGPMVLEIPAAEGGSIAGALNDGWQNALADVGPAGKDKGQGGRYLILPPGCEDRVPAGCIPVPSSTYSGYGLLRSDIKSRSDADLARAVAFGKRVKLYPIARAANPPKTIFVDAIDVLFDNTIPFDMRFFELLDRFVQREPWLERDKAVIGQLKSIGIEKGETFAPDAKTQEQLTNAAQEAHDWLDLKYEDLFSFPYYDGSHWALSVPPDVAPGPQMNFVDPNTYPFEDRAVSYSMAHSGAIHPGEGQCYLKAIRDDQDRPLYGDCAYQLNVPANAPVKIYWSVTAYDRATHALIRNQPWSSRSSQTPGLQKNADGSVDVYFGPEPPAGKKSNWIPTNAHTKFEVLFRLHGPEKAFFTKSWRLHDVEQVTAKRLRRAA